MSAPGSRSLIPFVVCGLAVALVIGVFVSGMAASTPDAQQRAVIESECAGAADKEACLAEAEGEPVLGFQPAVFFDYGLSWLSGLVGVLATFAVGAGILLLLRGGSSTSARGNRVR